MSIEQVKNEIRRFLSTQENLCLCMSGKWGVGKTYTWNTLLAEAMRSKVAKPNRYSYVSLFGLQSLSDVRRHIFENTVESAAFNSLEETEVSVSNLSKRLAALSSKWRAGVSIFRGIPVVSDYSDLVDKIGFLEVRNQIVCFDDLERISEDLSIKDVLGLISLLKEKKNCKVLILLNEEALQEKNAEEFKSQLEKIADIKLSFAPTTREAIEIAIPKKTEILGFASANLAILEVSNIRTIYKIVRMSGRVEELLSGYDDRIIRQAIHSACLYGFSVFQPQDAPPIEKILKWDTYYYAFNKEKEISDDEKRWSDLLTRYGYNETDPLDLAIFEGVKSGIWDKEKIRKEADIIARRITLGDLDAAFSKAWSIYHDSFENNAEEFALALKNSIVDNAIAISRSNLSSSISMLKKLGHGDNINAVINKYIEKRNDEGRDFWTNDHFFSGFHTEDPDVSAAFEEKAKEFNDDRKLDVVLTDIVRNKGWDKDTLPYIDSHSEDDFYNALKKARGDELLYIARGLTYFLNVGNPDQTMQSINEKAMAAFQRIGRESQINRLRVSKFGINIPDD